MSTFFDYADANGLALLPIPYGFKEDLGWKRSNRETDPTLRPIVWRWSEECSTSRAQWEQWHEQHECNFGIAAAASGCVAIDIDVSADPDIWAKFCAFWTKRGIAPPSPQFKSARDGWHVLVRVPDDVDAGSMGQPDLMPNVNIRTAGYIVAPGSFYDGTPKGQASGHYQLVSDAPPPHVRPDVFAVLLEACGTKGAAKSKTSATAATAPTASAADLSLLPPLDEVVARVQHSYDVGPVSLSAAGKWIRDPDAHAGCSEREREQRNGNGYFAYYAQWMPVVGAIKALYGEAARSRVSVLMSRGREVTKMFESTWGGKAPSADIGYAALKGFISASNSLGFDDGGRFRAAKGAAVLARLAAIAPVAGADAPPPPQGATTMMGATQATSDLGMPIVAAFNNAHAIAHAADAPTFPLEIKTPLLRGPLIEALGKLFTLADRDGGALRFDTYGELLGVLSQAHEISLPAVIARIRSVGVQVPEGRLKRSLQEFENAITRATRTGKGWHLGLRNQPDPNVSENVDVLLEFRGTRLRFNRWLGLIEYENGDGVWRKIKDEEIDSLLYFARSADHRFNVGKEFLRSCLNAISHRFEVDPVRDHIDSLIWDGVPRLDTWLTRACGVKDDLYHRTVGRNLIGGIVKRIRHPGCAHDEMVVLISPGQGKGKSTLCKILALDPAWHSDNLNPLDKATDLIPQLAGKLIIEFGEMADWNAKSAKKIKQFVTTVNDNFTRKFEAFASDQFRRCVFVGTTNDATPLRDQTGNRRFLPVRVVGEVDLVWARENIDQLLAEAAHLESSGTDFSIPREVWDIAGKHQAAARKSTEAEEQILRWFARPESEDRRYVMSADLGDALRRLKISTNHQFGMVFADLGYSSCEPYIDGRKQNAWATDKDIAGASQWVLNGNGTDVRWVLRTPVAPATPTVPLPLPY